MGTTLPGINQLHSLQKFSLHKENKVLNNQLPPHQNVLQQYPSPSTTPSRGYFDYKVVRTTSSNSPSTAGGISPSDSSAPPLSHYSSTPNYSYQQHHYSPHHQHLLQQAPTSLGNSIIGVPQSVGSLQSSIITQPQHVLSYNNNNNNDNSSNSNININRTTNGTSFSYQQPLISPLESQPYMRPLRAQSYDANLRLPSIQELVSPVPSSQHLQNSPPRIENKPQSQTFQPQMQNIQPGFPNQASSSSSSSSQPPINTSQNQHTTSSPAPTHSIHHIHHMSHLQPRKIRKRTRTGCLTCRKRRIKCDERKPYCNNCEKSKKCCAGYVDISKKRK